MLSPCQAKAQGAALGISSRRRRKKRKIPRFLSAALEQKAGEYRQSGQTERPRGKNAAVPRSKEKQNRAAKSRGKNDYSTAEMPNWYA